MINSLKTGGKQGHGEKHGDVLERINRQYGKPEEKQREAVKKLGKDEFFKIMVTQIQHQDPLKPYQNEQMAAQMAQFSSLEQMINMNQSLDKLTQSQQPLHHLGAANLIGKYVTSDSSRLFHNEGKYSNIAFDLPMDAEKVRVTLINDRGEAVREFERSDLKQGPVSIEWDGKTESNFAAKSGQYLIQINAQTDQGKPIPVQTATTELVHGVAFEGKETVLLTGDVRQPKKLLLSGVHKIVDPADLRRQENNGVSESTIAAALAEVDRPSAGFSEDVSARYSPIDPNLVRKGQEKPVVPQRLSNEEIQKLIQSPDLSGANPVAAAIREGRAMAPEASDENHGVDPVNPAARERGVAGGQSVPSGADGSTAGQWTK